MITLLDLNINLITALEEYRATNVIDAQTMEAIAAMHNVDADVMYKAWEAQQ